MRAVLISKFEENPNKLTDEELRQIDYSLKFACDIYENYWTEMPIYWKKEYIRKKHIQQLIKEHMRLREKWRKRQNGLR